MNWVDDIVSGIELITCDDNFVFIWELSGYVSLGDDVNKAVVVIGNENALWCDTVNSFDVRTEKLFAATTEKTKREKEKKKRKTKSRETQKWTISLKT